jgi:hypothetical protein
MGNGSATSSNLPSWVAERFKTIEKTKSDKAVVKAEIKRLDEKLEGIEDKAEEHSCTKEGDIREMQTGAAASLRALETNTSEIKKVYRWYVRGLAALILFLITSGVGFVWYLAGMAFHLEAQGKALEKIELKLNQTPSAAEQMRSLERVMEEISTRTAEKAASKTAVRINGVDVKPPLP